jgi:hypothetical protein
MFNIYPLAPDYTLQVCASFEPPPAVRTRVDEIWAEEKKKRGNRLTNGTVYSLFDHRAACLRIQPAEYRHVLARRRAPELADAGLGIRPLAVTGVLVCADGLVLGRRSNHVCSDTGLWESAPAGGLSRPDAVGQLLEELREEVGLEPSQVILHDACGLVEDVGSGVIDIVFRLDSSASAGEVRDTHAARATNEYAELAIIPQSEIAGFLKTNEARLLPALRPILGLVGLL